MWHLELTQMVHIIRAHHLGTIIAEKVRVLLAQVATLLEVTSLEFVNFLLHYVVDIAGCFLTEAHSIHTCANH